MLNVSGRQALILAEALGFTIGVLARFPADSRPERNIEDMRSLLDEIEPDARSMAEADVARWLAAFRTAR